MSLLAFANLGVEEAPKATCPAPPRDVRCAPPWAENTQAVTMPDATHSLPSVDTSSCLKNTGFLKLPNTVQVFYSTTEGDVKGYYGGDGDIAVFKQPNGNIGVLQSVKGEWKTLIKTGESFGSLTHLFSKTDHCSTCGEKNYIRCMKVVHDEYYCDHCHKEKFDKSVVKKKKKAEPEKCAECGTWTPIDRLMRDPGGDLVCENCDPDLFVYDMF